MTRRQSAILILLIMPALSRANDFALNLGAHGPIPLDVRDGRESPIRLVEEQLEFRFGSSATSVRARFVFENTRSDSTVRQLSGFPDVAVERHPLAGEDDPYYAEDMRILNWEAPFVHPLRDMRAWIDGKPARSNVTTGYVRYNDEEPFAWLPADSVTGRFVRWHTVELVIPPKGRTVLEREYTTSNGFDGLAGRHFHYITLTGGPWHGSIGRLKATVILQDTLTSDNLHWAEPADSDFEQVHIHPLRPEWTFEAPGRFSFTWTDFEPLRDIERQQIVLVWRPDDMMELWRRWRKPKR